MNITYAGRVMLRYVRAIMGNLRGSRGMKSLDRLLGRSIRLGNPFVLAQVLEPDSTRNVSNMRPWSAASSKMPHA
jgi:hypothetical protein